ncbi:4-hydroxy-tetrahydrodipicolinate reductase [Chryseobacterium sp. MFBS3-17]|uniref:4-hydroxy-tetrahydrodipicolinate reductase n=1 Tax=Chryseobacterium sp. MFBS3-17 TaxID=2886689 RepID=UPI001D0E590A|nr:4-hydroxy-tetrahydrodipicolinate reductase [Chryseobacterium sp. MFBS3-17]MCC2590751.1 4-hydroxy-tetrahydrodipicolinate reductase [Chryseobacterium sp. MFBS3-17]
MKIALVGYGKMGKIIDEIAVERGHEVVARLRETPTAGNLNNPDVVIEFSNPEAAFQNISNCLELGIPVVCGTTGWLARRPEIEGMVLAGQGAFLYGSNFSLGVNLFFALNEKLAELMNRFPEYDVRMEETHHTHKKDAPSGTAITLAEGVIRHHDRFESWNPDKTGDAELGITSFREDEVPGTHKVFYTSEEDEIEIVHTAFSRKGFALGAVIAAEWIIGKSGNFTMNDVLNG